MIAAFLSRCPEYGLWPERVHRCRAWLVFLLLLIFLLAPGRVLAGISISAVTLEQVGNRTRIVIESSTEIRFSLLIFRYPERLVLELEGVVLNPVLAGLTDQVAADHPYLRPLQIRPSPSNTEVVQLLFGLKAEVEPNIRSLKPAAGRGYQLVLDITPPTEAATAPPAGIPRLPQPLASPTVSAVPAVPPAPPLLPAQKVAPVARTPSSMPPMPTASPPPVSTAPTVSPVAGPLPPPSRRTDEQNLVLLELQLDGHVLAEAITTYQHGRETFLPLGELARLLTLAIRTQPEQGTADGYVLSEERSFSLNVALARVTLAERTQVVDPALVQLQDDDIYVASMLLSRWLPLDFEVNLSSLTLRVKPKERLPLQERLERERLGAKVGTPTGYEDPGYPHQHLPYRLLGVPFIDQTFGTGLRTGNGSRQTSASYTAYLTGDLLGMESALFVSSTQQVPTPDVRFTLARHDPDAGLLGPLRARSVMFGSGVSAPSVANISSVSLSGKGYGLTLSNRPITQPTSFDRHTLRGDLPPGWDVELYFNEAFVGFQTSRADGRYSFNDQPLIYGPNEFRLVFHGPLGQQRVEQQKFLLEQSSTPPGTFYYNFTQHRNSASQSRSVAQFEWGLNKYLTGTGGFVRLPTLAGIGTTTAVATGSNSADGQLYTNLGLRGFWRSFIFSSDFVRASLGGWLNESSLKTRIGGVAISYSRILLRDFSSELFSTNADSLRTRDKVRLDGAIPVGFLPRLPVTLELLREQFQSGSTNLALTGRVAAYVNQTSVANQLTWQTSGRHTSASGALQLSRRVGGIGLSGQLDYSLKPQTKLETIALSGDKRVGEAYLLNLGLVRSLGSHETLLTAGLNKNLGSYGLGLSASYSSRGVVTVGLQLFIATSREPRQGQWRFDALPKAGSGATSVRVFLDHNGNGVMDASEEPIENVALTVNGSRAPVRTNAAGVALLDRLPIRQNVDIAVDPQTLEDPYWVPQRKGVRLVPRPGRVAELDFPVVLTSEIDGTVYLDEKMLRRGMGDVVIELLDPQRKVTSTIKSSSDGYYIIPAVVQGRYSLRVSPEQLKQFDLIDPGERDMIILPDGKFISGVDFLLSRNPTRTVSGIPRKESDEKK